MKKKSCPGYQYKRRNTHTRERKKVFWIATEGNNKTEINYFREMARTFNICVHSVPGNYTDPVQIAAAMRQCTRSDDYDKYQDSAYCLIDADCDRSRNTLLEQADKIAEKNGFQILVSAPCFEVWLLCHFLFSTQQYNSNDKVLCTLRQHLPDYTKGNTGIFNATEQKLCTALENAEHLETHCRKNGYTPHTTEFQPSTQVYILIVDILQEHNKNQ